MTTIAELAKAIAASADSLDAQIAALASQRDALRAASTDLDPVVAMHSVIIDSFLDPKPTSESSSNA